jgi:hypothetical protein
MKRKPPKNGFKKGHKKMGGRKLGTPNKFTGTIKELSVDMLPAKGQALVADLEHYEQMADYYASRAANPTLKRRRFYRAQRDHFRELVRQYEQYRMGGALAAMLWFGNKEPHAYLALLAKLLPLQIEGKLNGKVTHRFETVEEVEKEFRARGLPVPPRMIDVTPTKTVERKAA